MPELMKGEVWAEHKHTMTYPAVFERKVDEVRCHVIVDAVAGTVQYLSYAGKPLHNLSRFDAAWLTLALDSGYTEFDTGFDVEGGFKNTYRWVRSSKNGVPEDIATCRTRFLLFDLPQHPGDYATRCVAKNNVWVLALSIEDFRLDLPFWRWVRTPEDVLAEYAYAIDDGYEGGMVKSLDHTYKRGKRIKGWLKVKPSSDADGVIEELIEAHSLEGEPLGRIGSVLVRVEDGSYARPHGIDFDLGARMYENPSEYIGQWCEFKYMERDRQGGYRHPTFNRIREEK